MKQMCMRFKNGDGELEISISCGGFCLNNRVLVSMRPAAVFVENCVPGDVLNPLCRLAATSHGCQFNFKLTKIKCN